MISFFRNTIPLNILHIKVLVAFMRYFTYLFCFDIDLFTIFFRRLKHKNKYFVKYPYFKYISYTFMTQ